MHQKLAVATSLHKRVVTHVSKPAEQRLHRKAVKKTLMLNGYPAKFSEFRQIESAESALSSQNDSADPTPPPSTSFTTLPYIKGISDKIKRVLNEAGVKVALKPVSTLRNCLPSLKDPVATSEKSCLIYQVPCRDCDFSYIGQTKRDLKSRISEHKRAIRSQEPEKSALCLHSISLDHVIAWSDVQILKVEPDFHKRLFAESWYINEKSPIMNRNDGLAFPSVYKKLFDR